MIEWTIKDSYLLLARLAVWKSKDSPPQHNAPVIQQKIRKQRNVSFYFRHPLQ